MQLNLDFFDRPDAQQGPPVTWEQIDEAARIAAIELLARLIARLLQDDPATETGDE